MYSVFIRFATLSHDAEPSQSVQESAEFGLMRKGTERAEGEGRGEGQEWAGGWETLGRRAAVDASKAEGSWAGTK